MNISLPAELKDFVDAQVATGGYGTSSEFVRDLIRRERDRLHLRALIMEGMASGKGEPADDAYFARLKAYAKRRATR